MSQQPSAADILTNNGKGRYWDEVYSTSTNGTINASYPDPHLIYLDSLAKKVRYVNTCIYFSGQDHVMHYVNLDSVRVRDIDENSDALLNPGYFKLRDDTLIFALNMHHKILTLTPQAMVLEYVFKGKKSVRVYLPSRFQLKQVIKQSSDLSVSLQAE
jgi:hypothetical protein